MQIHRVDCYFQTIDYPLNRQVSTIRQNYTIMHFRTYEVIAPKWLVLYCNSRLRDVKHHQIVVIKTLQTIFLKLNLMRLHSL